MKHYVGTKLKYETLRWNKTEISTLRWTKLKYETLCWNKTKINILVFSLHTTTTFVNFLNDI